MQCPPQSTPRPGVTNTTHGGGVEYPYYPVEYPYYPVEYPYYPV